MQLCCLLNIPFEFQQSWIYCGSSRARPLEVYTGMAMLRAIPATGVYGLIQYRSDDTAFIWPPNVWVGRVDPPVSEDCSMTVACIYKEENNALK